MLFSERKGLKPIRKVLQINDIDDVLRKRIWNKLCIYYWGNAKTDYGFVDDEDTVTILKRLWHDLLKESIDTIDYYWKNTYQKLRGMYFNFKWNEVYDFIEFIANNYPDRWTNEKFIKACNKVFKEDLSAYRFIEGQIVDITSEDEIAEVERAIISPVQSVGRHIKRALELLGDRKKPDYRNSIKESISAVEAICTLIAKKPNATLGEALRTIEKEGIISIHGALKQGFMKIYGYTSNEKGIRHALAEKSGIDSEDAKFMLVSCSAFANYLLEKASKAKINM